MEDTGGQEGLGHTMISGSTIVYVLKLAYLAFTKQTHKRVFTRSKETYFFLKSEKKLLYII